MAAEAPREVRIVPAAEHAFDFTFGLQVDGQPLVPPDNVCSVVASTITPQDYTRMGAPIRHRMRRLNEADARRSGVPAFCITIDTEANDYLPHMYGAANFVVVDQVASLPLKLSNIRYKLTT